MSRNHEAVKLDVRRRMRPSQWPSMALICEELCISLLTLNNWTKTGWLQGEVVSTSEKYPEDLGSTDRYLHALGKRCHVAVWHLRSKSACTAWSEGYLLRRYNVGANLQPPTTHHPGISTQNSGVFPQHTCIDQSLTVFMSCYQPSSCIWDESIRR